MGILSAVSETVPKVLFEGNVVPLANFENVEMVERA